MASLRDSIIRVSQHAYFLELKHLRFQILFFAGLVLLPLSCGLGWPTTFAALTDNLLFVDGWSQYSSYPTLPDFVVDRDGDKIIVLDSVPGASESQLRPDKLPRRSESETDGSVSRISARRSRACHRHACVLDFAALRTTRSVLAIPAASSSYGSTRPSITWHCLSTSKTTLICCCPHRQSRIGFAENSRGKNGSHRWCAFWSNTRG